MNGARKPTAPIAVVAALLALVLHILQPAMAMRDAAGRVADEITATEAMCGEHAKAGIPGDDGQQADHCKICHTCCVSHADLAVAPVLPPATWRSWSPVAFARATPVRGPPTILARARAPPSLS